MAKNHIITRKGNTLNLNTNKGVRMENLYATGDELERVSGALTNLGVGPTGTVLSAASGYGAAGSSGSKGKALDSSGIIAAGIGGAATGLGAYNKLANNYNTDIYDSALGAVPQAVSIGNYDALADWKRSNPVLVDPTADDLDTMGTSGKIGAGLSTIGSMTATGAQAGSLFGGILGFGAGVGTVLSGLGEGKRKRERLAKDIAFKNSLAGQRLNSMYLHELGDIQEEQANQALANLEANGGKIHIKPSKRGTFRAQAKRMGMSVQEAARHILANKNRYSPAMRKKAAFAKAAAGWKHEDGGPLFQFPVEYNHGGYFTLDPELVKIDQGGTHEQNPLDGVPMGFDENGIPNLVEEGETIFDDYVFSNRLAPTEKQLAEGGLATKYKNHTFADISAKIAKTFEETPTDFIARESFKESMQRLKTIQEQVRDENPSPDMQMLPDQQVAPQGMDYVGQPSMEEQIPMEQMPEEMPQEYPQEMPQDIMGQPQVPMQPEMMQAYGGNLFVRGGDIDKDSLIAELRKRGYNDMQIGFFLDSRGNVRTSYLKRTAPDLYSMFTTDSERNTASSEREDDFSDKEIDKRAREKASKRAKEGTAAYNHYYKEALNEERESKARHENAEKLRKEHPELMSRQGNVGSIYSYSEDQYKAATDYLRSRGYNYPTDDLDEETEKEYRRILYGENQSSNISSEAGYTPSFEDEPMESPTPASVPSDAPASSSPTQEQSSVEIKGRPTSGVAGQTVNAGTGAGNSSDKKYSATSSSRRYNTTEDVPGLTAEQRRETWYNSSGRALIDSLNNAKKDWDTRGLRGEDLTKEQRAYVDAMNAVQEAYTKAYEAGYDPETHTSNKDAAVRVLQELWEQNKGNKYFESLLPKVITKGISGDNKNQGWKDDLWGAITKYRNWGLTEYYGDSTVPIPDDIRQSLVNAGITYTPEYNYGKNGYKAYKFGLKGDRQAMDLPEMPQNLLGIKDPNGYTLNDNQVRVDNGTLQRPNIALTPEQEKARARVQRKLDRQARREERGAGKTGTGTDKLPTWMRYAPIFGAGLGAIWDMAEKPDYSVAEATERMAANVPRVRFNPIGNYLTYKPVDRNFYLNQIRNQGLATDRGILNASGANQGAATAGLLASQYNTQGNIGNSLMQQEIANRQNEQQVAQFNRGTDQYNSQGLFNESVYNQRAGMHAGQYMLTAAQLRQAERQRRNAAISANLTNLFQGIGDIGWENMNRNMTKIPGLYYGIDKNNVVSHIPNEVAATNPNTNIVEATYTGTPTPEQVEEQAKRAQQGKYGGMLTKRKKSKSRR